MYRRKAYEKTLMEIINELMKMKDDEKFCKAEYEVEGEKCYEN